MLRKIILSIAASVAIASASAQNSENKMDRIETCKQNYAALFGGEALTGVGSDPEMMDMLQKYIFGEVFTVGELDRKTREMITCVALASMQTLPQLKAHAGAALNVGVTPLELREAMYLLSPFIGFPKTLNAIATVNEVLAERGVKLPLEPQATTGEADRMERGKEIQDRLYPGGIASVMAGVPDGLGGSVERLLTGFCFGDIYSRGTLDIETRELLTYCVLVAIGADSQLHSHFQGSLRAGNTPGRVAAAVVQCLPYVGFPAAIKALRIIAEENSSRK